MKKKIILAIIASLIILAIGFLLGRSMSTVVTKIEYVKEPPISGLITGLVPVSEEKPEKPNLPVRRDTVYINNVIYVTEKVDSAAIIADYELKRTYSVPVFDNQYGKLDLTFNTQYNKSDSIKYEFFPIVKVKTVTKERAFAPFASASYLSTGHAGFGGGFFYKKIGVEYQRLQAIRPDEESGNMFNVKYKF